MQREEAETVVRSQKLMCLGPWNEGKEAEYAALVAAGQMEHAQAVRDRYRGIPRKTRDGVVYDPCGFDLSIVVAQGPLDGSECAVECPKCRRIFEYRAPVFEVEEEV